MGEKLRIWWWRDYGYDRQTEYYEVSSIEEAKQKIKELTEQDLKNPNILANAGGLEIFEDGEWTEYYDDMGRDITEIMEDEEGEIEEVI